MAVNAQAGDIKPYAGIGIGSFTTDYGTGIKSKSSIGGFLQAGVNVNPYIAAELRIGGVSSSNVSAPATPGTTSKVNSFVSYLVKPQFPVAEHTKVYALIGATTEKVSLTVPGFGTGSSTKTQISFGGGVAYKLQNNLSIGAEYVQYSNNANGLNNKAKVTGFSGTIEYSF